MPMTLLCAIHTCPKCQGDKSSTNDVCKSCLVGSVEKDNYDYVENTSMQPHQAVYAKAPNNFKLSESNYVEGELDEFDA